MQHRGFRVTDVHATGNLYAVANSNTISDVHTAPDLYACSDTLEYVYAEANSHERANSYADSNTPYAEAAADSRSYLDADAFTDRHTVACAD